MKNCSMLTYVDNFLFFLNDMIINECSLMVIIFIKDFKLSKINRCAFATILFYIKKKLLFILQTRILL